MSSSSLSYVRLQAGLTREVISLPDCSVELAAANGAADQTLLAVIRDAAESFVNRRVSSLHPLYIYRPSDY